MNIDKLDDFTRAYMECALWSSTDTVKDDDGMELDVHLDDNHDITDISPETAAKMIADCNAFQSKHAVLLKRAYKSDIFIDGERYNPSNAGHDFWLTRNGHGVGFQDRGLGKAGEMLSKHCGWKTEFPEIHLYIGDDGKIYAA